MLEMSRIRWSVATSMCLPTSNRMSSFSLFTGSVQVGWSTRLPPAALCMHVNREYSERMFELTLRRKPS